VISGKREGSLGSEPGDHAKWGPPILICAGATACAVGDADSIDVNFELPDGFHSRVGTFDLTDFGMEMILFTPGENFDLCVEVSEADDGLRVCVESDADDIRGRWKRIGELVIGLEGCLVTDPFRNRPANRAVIEINTGIYNVDVLEDGSGRPRAIRLKR